MSRWAFVNLTSPNLFSFVRINKRNGMRRVSVPAEQCTLNKCAPDRWPELQGRTQSLRRRLFSKLLKSVADKRTRTPCDDLFPVRLCSSAALSHSSTRLIYQFQTLRLHFYSFITLPVNTLYFCTCYHCVYSLKIMIFTDDFLVISWLGLYDIRFSVCILCFVSLGK